MLPATNSLRECSPAAPNRFNLDCIAGARIGCDDTDLFSLGPEGLAIRTTDDRFVSCKSGGDVVDVTCAVFCDGTDLVYRIPIAAAEVKEGDLLVLSDNPVRLLFVRKVHKPVASAGTKKTEAAPEAQPQLPVKLEGFDPRTSTKVEYTVPRNIFGVQLLVKVVSLWDQIGLGGGAPGTGNNWWYLALCGNGGIGRGSSGGDCNDNALLALAMSQSAAGSGGNAVSPWMWLLMSRRRS